MFIFKVIIVRIVCALIDGGYSGHEKLFQGPVFGGKGEETLLWTEFVFIVG